MEKVATNSYCISLLKYNTSYLFIFYIFFKKKKRKKDTHTQTRTLIWLQKFVSQFVCMNLGCVHL